MQTFPRHTVELAYISIFASPISCCIFTKHSLIMVWRHLSLVRGRTHILARRWEEFMNGNLTLKSITFILENKLVVTYKVNIITDITQTYTARKINYTTKQPVATLSMTSCMCSKALLIYTVSCNGFNYFTRVLWRAGVAIKKAKLRAWLNYIKRKFRSK